MKHMKKKGIKLKVVEEDMKRKVNWNIETRNFKTKLTTYKTNMISKTISFLFYYTFLVFLLVN